MESAADDCKKGDGLLDTTATRGFTDVVWECSQIPCMGTEPEVIYNFMSVSILPLSRL